jgi:vacuolar-type H+-ATPase subunit H
MGLELIIFIAAILFGILLYWRESNGNGLYRFLNKIINSKELQMKSTNPKGFVYKQDFLPRLVYVVALFLVCSLILQFLTPFKIFGSYNGISIFASSIVGTLIGTYVANFVIKSGDVIEKKSGSLGEMVSDAVEKGKDLLDDAVEKGKDVVSDFKEDTKDVAENVSEKTETIKEDIKAEGKSARDRLKDKGLL